jgi:hypothetical protein
MSKVLQFTLRKFLLPVHPTSPKKMWRETSSMINHDQTNHNTIQEKRRKTKGSKTILTPSHQYPIIETSLVSGSSPARVHLDPLPRQQKCKL